MYRKVVDFIRDIYNTNEFIPLHEPRFTGKEKDYLLDCLQSTFVSSVGEYVNKFEQMVCSYTGSSYAIATMNGTAALHTALLLSGVKSGDFVITQPLTFVATGNAIKYLGADPVFVDIDYETLGLSPAKLLSFLESECMPGDDGCYYHKKLGKRIAACLPMHTFGHPGKIDQISEICEKYNVALVEDAAESIGSFYKDKHTGTFGLLGVLSFNGNKTITCGGGGMILTNDQELAGKAKHLTTTAKTPHRWEYIHDEVGFNYRLPNLNAALACAQMEQLSTFVQNKRELAFKYKDFFSELNIEFVTEPEGATSSYWLNAILLDSHEQKEEFLKYTNDQGIMTRPAWRLLSRLNIFDGLIHDSLTTAEMIEKRLVNIPSSVSMK